MLRVHGRFAWPPLPQAGSQQSQPVADGTIEFGFAPIEGKTEVQPFVRWIPHVDGAAPAEVTKQTRNLAQLEESDRAAIAAASKTSFAFMLGKAPRTSPNPKVSHLRFTGAVVFEQFQPSGDGGDEVVTRWLLARSFARAGKTCTSEVLVGLRGDLTKENGSSIALALALPTPVTQSIDAGKTCGAFPFVARYRPAITRVSSSRPLDAYSIAPGTIEDDEQEVKWADAEPLRCYYLGGFGFARTDGGADALHFPRGLADPADEREESTRRRQRARFWLGDPSTVVNQILGKVLGADPGIARALDTFATETRTDGQGFSFAAETYAKGEISNSIYFSGTGDRTIMRFRHALHATRSHARGSVQIVGSAGSRQFSITLPGIATPIRSNSDVLLIEITVEYELDAGAIWDAVKRSTSLEGAYPETSLTLAFGLGGSLAKDMGSGNATPGQHGVATLLDGAARATRRAREALRRVDGAQPDSILPDVEFTTRSDFRLAYCMKAQAAFGGGSGAELSWSLPATSPGRLSGRLTLWPPSSKVPSGAPDAAPLVGSEVSSLPVKLTFPLFELGAATPVSARLRHDPAAYGRMEHETFAASLRVDPQGGTPPLRARLGGLAFGLAGSVLRDDEAGELSGQQGDDYSHWRFDERDPVASDLAGEGSHRLRLRFVASSTEPLVPDTARGDRSGRPRPLLVPLRAMSPATGDMTPTDAGAPGTGEPIAYILDARETIGARADRLLVADIIDLREDVGPRPPDSYVILSEQPFSISRFESQPLRYRGSADKAIVASYSSDTRTWSLKQVAEHYHYAFPAQAVGEAMDKPRRLEIHDPVPSDPAGALLPYASTIAEPKGGPPVPRRHLVQYRLTPSAEIWIRPSDVEQGFFRPEWATHAIFREAGALGVGAALRAFRGEFVYGLSAGVDISREKGVANGARVAEVDALVGRPPGPIASAAVDREVAQRWSRTMEVLARRPERLEFWMQAPGTVRVFTPARFTEGVSFALRNSAVHRAPLESPLIEPERSAGPRVRPYGLQGGALWPLESALFTQRLLESPQSSGGTIERVALSPHGGDADQRAEFLAGQVAIIAETRNGRVQRQRVEIVGRISVFWHRAKHVVIYERTVSPSQQFASEGGIGTRSRRPILRKVSEFIELIEPTRHYPDNPAADATTAGFLDGIRFNSKVIAVDSAWSEEIPEAGWRIPLWNRHAARQRPSVYPRPDIVALTAAEGAGERPTTAQEILDPDNVYFFADAVAGHADTDRWGARCGIDFANLPPPNHKQQPPVVGAKGQGPGRRLPAAPRFPRGQRLFTWRLGASAKKTAVNAGRAQEPVFAALDTISFQRATPPTNTGPGSPSDLTGNLMEHAGELQSPRGLAEALGAFSAAAAGTDDQNLLASAKALATSLSDAVTGRPDHALGDLGALIMSAPKDCERMLDQLTSGVERQKLLLLDQLRSWQSGAAETLLAANPKGREDLVQDALAKIGKLAKPLMASGVESLGKVGEGAERARHIVQDIQEDLHALELKARQRIAAIKASYDRAKPWSPARIGDVLERLGEVRDGIVGDLEAAAVEYRSRLAVEVDGVTRRLSVEIAGQVETLLKTLRAAQAEALGGSGEVQVWLGAIRSRSSALSAPGGYLSKARSAVDKLPARHAAVRARLLGLLGDLETLAVDVSARLDQIALGASRAEQVIAAVQAEVVTKGTEAASLLAEFERSVQEIADVDTVALTAEIRSAADQAKRVILSLASLAGSMDGLADDFAASASRLTEDLPARIKPLFAAIDELQKLAGDEIGKLQARLRDGDLSLQSLLLRKVLEPALRDSLAILSEVGAPTLAELQRALDTLVPEVERGILAFASGPGNELQELEEDIQKACGLLSSGFAAAMKELNETGDKLAQGAADALSGINGTLGDVQRLRQLAGTIGTDAAAARDLLEKNWVGASAYADSVFHAAGQIGSGGISAAPGQILRLFAAVGSAPALPNLDFARERLGYYYKQLSSVIDTTPAEAWFGRLGDELKAMGLELPFEKLTDRIVPKDLSKLDIGAVFRNFGGLDLRRLFRDVKLPSSAEDAIKLTHAFDKAQARAWVQIDIDVLLPGRRALIGVGPFKLDLVDARLSGTLRLEASKDTATVEQTGHATLLTDFDAVVSGQSMVRLQKLGINYDKSNGLKVDFDPSNIKINPTLKFIQDTLGQIVPDTVGGLKIVKERGIPVGVSHDFAMPPVSLMAGTSGVSNIAISNQFALIAYPDFVISDRFCLSRPELPFLFSIFIIGGTGYITVDVEYRPFSSALMVTVEAAVGGSAALGFAAGPVSGSVFITLSVALSYRKLIGQPGGGLTIACVLLIAGNVDVAGLATVYISLLLRMSYREDGRIDGVGTLTITVRITRFFKFTVRRDVTFKLRGGGGGKEANALPASGPAFLASTGSSGDPASAEDEARRRAVKILSARS